MFSFTWPFFYLNRQRVAIVALVLAVGVSRVYVGVHYPIDIASAVIASAVGFALIYIARDAIMTVADYCIRIESRLRTTLRRSL